MLARTISPDLTDKQESIETIDLCASLSESIYSGVFTTFIDYILFHSYEDKLTGYRGACYAKDLLSEHTKMFIVHRGTVIDFDTKKYTTIVDLLGDLELALGHVPLQYKSAKIFLEEIDKKIEEVYHLNDPDGGMKKYLPYLNPITTGHSLGAVLSDCVSVFHDLPSITFENPGAKPIIKALLGDKNIDGITFHCTGYQSGVNLINTCNEQVGRTFRIKVTNGQYMGWEDDMLPYFPISSSYLLDTFYIYSNTTYQHPIHLVVGRLQDNHYMVDPIHNPIGFKAGYIEYINPSYKGYWESYFNWVWLFTPSYREKYNNDETMFNNDCFKILTKIYKEAKGENNFFNNRVVLFKPKPTCEEIINDFVMVDKEEEKPGYCPMM